MHSHVAIPLAQVASQRKETGACFSVAATVLGLLLSWLDAGSVDGFSGWGYCHVGERDSPHFRH